MNINVKCYTFLNGSCELTGLDYIKIKFLKKAKVVLTLLVFIFVVADINECQISFGICSNGTCVNTPGMFRCQCDEGFRPVMMDQMCMGKASILDKLQGLHLCLGRNETNNNKKKFSSCY